MKTNKEIRQEARAALSGHWTEPVITTIVFMLISGLTSAVFGIPESLTNAKVLSNVLGGTGSLLSLVVTLPLGYGMTTLFLKFYRTQEKIAFGELFDGFRDFVRIFGTLLLETVYILLWCLLLFVPGIIKSYSYAMTPYILKEHPELSYNEAIEKSMVMMEGHKMDLFKQDLVILGWGLLSILTLCIGFLWVIPYQYTIRAAFYEELKASCEVSPETL